MKKYVNTTKLADGLAKTGVLNDFAMERSLQAVCEFVQMAQKQNAQVHILQPRQCAVQKWQCFYRQNKRTYRTSCGYSLWRNGGKTGVYWCI